MALKYVRDTLVAAPAVTAIVGSKIFPVQLPESTTPPMISLHRISATPENSLGGFSGIDVTVVAVDCWAADYQGLLALRDAVRTCMQAAGWIMATEVEEFNDPVRVYHISQHWNILQ
jgi:Protein of unknown function (DUF3168)